MMKRVNFNSGSPWEDKVGYSRAVKVNNIIEVAGTTATKDGQIIGKDDPYIQAEFILSRIAGILQELGSNMSEVVRTRIYVVDIDHWKEIGKAHRKFFKNIKPASTMVEVNSLIDPDLLVEIEVTAVLN
jgi:enamine deaminase RidA (YjgF/YER057c/UK114 family)